MFWRFHIGGQWHVLQIATLIGMSPMWLCRFYVTKQRQQLAHPLMPKSLLIDWLMSRNQSMQSHLKKCLVLNHGQ